MSGLRFDSKWALCTSMKKPAPFPPETFISLSLLDLSNMHNTGFQYYWDAQYWLPPPWRTSADFIFPFSYYLIFLLFFIAKLFKRLVNASCLQFLFCNSLSNLSWWSLSHHSGHCSSNGHLYIAAFDNYYSLFLATFSTFGCQKCTLLVFFLIHCPFLHIILGWFLFNSLNFYEVMETYS